MLRYNPSVFVACYHGKCSRLFPGNSMNSLHDRLRIPWRAGARQISFDSLLPIFLQPLLVYLAALNVLFTGFVAVVIVLCFWYMYFVYVRRCPRTKFFCVWTIMSIVLLILVFEVNVVPLLEILPEENIVFIVITTFSLFCLYKVWSRSKLNRFGANDGRDDLLMCRNKATEEVCSVCRKRVPPRTFHCNICQTCILRKDHHCVWLDCCIGEKNHCLFVLALFLSFCALSYGAALTLTSVCHPFVFMELILLPDDCSDVYHDFEIALCFVSALYSLLVALLVLYLLWHHCWFISLGITRQEWQDLSCSERRCWGFWSKRPYNRGFVCNWVQFLCCRTIVLNSG